MNIIKALQPQRHFGFITIVLFCTACFLTSCANAKVESVTGNGLTLAQDGKALMPIVISDKASDSTKAVATEFAGYLKRITGAMFEVRTGGQFRHGYAFSYHPRHIIRVPAE